MLTLYFENSSFGVIMSWSGRDGSSHRKWARGHLWYTSLTPHQMQHILLDSIYRITLQSKVAALIR